MKALSIVLAVVAACLLALIAVFWFGGALGAEVAIAPAIAGEEALAAVEDVQNGLAVDVLTPIDETRDCALTDITVTFANSGLFDAEWLTCSLARRGRRSPVRAERHQAGRGGALAGAADLAGTHAGRRRGRALDVEYYVLGMRRTDDRAAGWLKEAPGD